MADLKKSVDRIPVRIGRRTLYAVYSEAESNLPNAKPTYRVYTRDGTYVMNMVDWQVAKNRIEG